MIYEIEKYQNINIASQLLIDGEIIIYSTDTLYGFGVDSTNDIAIDALNRIKGRLQPYSIIVDSFTMLKKYAQISEIIEGELQKIFPGPFTAILDKADSNLSKLVTVNLSTVGIRIPNFKPILEIVNKINRPIITTSVNYHNQSSLNTLDEIKKQFSDISIFTDYNNQVSKGSTIIDFSINPYKILRQGDGIY